MVLKPEEFTDAARQVLHDSQQIVQRYRHAQWDAEHILMALLERRQGVPADALAAIGADVPQLRQRLHALLEQSPKTARPSQQIYQTPRIGLPAVQREGRGGATARRLHQRGAPAYRADAGHAGPYRAHARRAWRNAGSRLSGAPEYTRRAPRNRPASREPLPLAGTLHHRPDAACKGRQARPHRGAR